MCKSRYGAGYWFGTDGSYVDPKAGQHWLKVMDAAVLSRGVGKTYIVDGSRPTIKGQITATAVTEVVVVKAVTQAAPVAAVLELPKPELPPMPF